MLSVEQMDRVVRRGWLFTHNGQPFKVPKELWDIYKEEYPHLGNPYEQEEER